MSNIRNICFALSLLLAMFLAPAVSFAGEIDILVDKLVEKGILSHGEAQEILTETREEVRAQMAMGELDTLPGWVQNTKLKGDLRLRYQYDDKDKDSVSGRHRERIRFRLGMESKVNDQWKIAAGLAPGSSDPRSTNQTLQDTFSSKGIQLDYAYAQYTAAPWLTMYGGKMKRKPVLWEPTDLLWDSDINPEGAAFALTKDVDSVQLFANAGLFVLDESSSSSSEPWMAYVQPGLKWDLNGNVSLKTTVTGYLINTKGYDMDNSSNTNTLDGSNHKYDYDSVSPAVELSIKEPLNGIVPYFAAFGEYINAQDPSDKNKGYSLGFKFGEKSVKDRGQWQTKYIYRYLERDAWFDGFPDSDAYDGDTNVKGHEVILNYGLGKNVMFGLDYYHMKPIDDVAGMSTDAKQDVVQADIVMKF